MPARQPYSRPWPRRWLMTDERMDEALWPALLRVPRGGGVILRHDRLPFSDRLALGQKLAVIARRRGLVLGVAGDVSLARLVGADLVHRPRGPAGSLPLSLPVHDEVQALAARRQRPALVFVSPMFPTRSHSERRTLSVERAGRLAILAGAPAIALGGMDESRWRALGSAFHGYAGIDCWLRI